MKITQRVPRAQEFDQSVGRGARGLDEREVEASRREHGNNLLSRRRGKSFFLQFLSNLNDPVIRILLGALIVNLLLSFGGADWMETVGIGVAVLLAALISTASEYTSARAFARLSEESAKESCRVRREGGVREIPIGEVVVGDVVLLSAGDGIPADGRVTQGLLGVDQSAMTGESREVRKEGRGTYAPDPANVCALFRGSLVASGEGEMVVTAVGDATFLGEISHEIQGEGRESPLKVRLTRLARQISIVGYVAAVLVMLAYLFNVFILDSGIEKALILYKLFDLSYVLTHLFRALTLGLTVLVVAVPEGLPMMIAVVLASNMKRMVKDRVLVRKPVGIEAAGSMNLLFTDKTGTLTEGRMRVDGILSCGERMAPKELLRRGGERAEWISLGFRYCNDATLTEGGRRAVGGNATARALLESVAPYPSPHGYNVRARLPFDSARKYAAVTLFGKRSGTLVLGAPERLFPFVTGEMREDGSILPFSRRRATELVGETGKGGERVLALALASDVSDARTLAGGVRGDLILLCAVALRDPLRRCASRAVADLRGAGVQVVMITGDARATAESIARGCGILGGGVDLVLSGEELSRMSDARVRELLPRLGAVCRALPSDKSRLVRLSQEMNLVVGMTGDGINDSPALRRADVGFSMGSGTQVAKDASDVVILDDNLASIVRAVLYGRGIFKSIRKYITLQLTMNLCAVGVSMICPFLGVDSPVTVVQMLWINLIMDTLGGLAFSGEEPLPEFMREPPKRREEPILNRYMIDQIVLLGGFTVALCIWFLKSPTVTSLFRSSEGNLTLLTAFFALFIFSSVLNCFNARTDRLRLFAGIRKNPVFLFIMAAILAIQITFVYLGGTVLRTVPLTARELAVTALLSAAVIPAEIIRKALWRLRGKRNGF